MVNWADTEPELVILNQMAILPVPDSTAYRAATSSALPTFVASPVKRRRKRFGPAIVMSYAPAPEPVPMLKKSVAVPASTVYCHGVVSR